MALDMSGAKTKQTLSLSSSNSSTDLKKVLSENQMKKAKEMYFDIRKSFLQAGAPMTRHDTELAELIRLKIIDTLLAEEF